MAVSYAWPKSGELYLPPQPQAQAGDPRLSAWVRQRNAVVQAQGAVKARIQTLLDKAQADRKLTVDPAKGLGVSVAYGFYARGRQPGVQEAAFTFAAPQCGRGPCTGYVFADANRGPGQIFDSGRRLVYPACKPCRLCLGTAR